MGSIVLVMNEKIEISISAMWTCPKNLYFLILFWETQRLKINLSNLIVKPDGNGQITGSPWGKY
jgi:hypothetical protein